MFPFVFWPKAVGPLSPTTPLSCVDCGLMGNETVIGNPMVGAGQGAGWGAW